MDDIKRLFILPFFLLSPIYLPYSVGLFWLLFVISIGSNVYFTSEVAQLAKQSVPMVSIFVIVLVYETVSFWLLGLLFNYYQYANRALKCLTAWFFIECLMSVAKGCIMIGLGGSKPELMTRLVMLTLIVYELFIKGYILKHGLSIPLAQGVVWVIGLRMMVIIPTLIVASF